MDSPPSDLRLWHTRPYETVASKYNKQPTTWSKTVAYVTAAYHTAVYRTISDGGIQVQQTAHRVVEDCSVCHHGIPYRGIQDHIRRWHPSTTNSPPRGRRPRRMSPRHTGPYQMVASKYNKQPTAWLKTAAYVTAAYKSLSDGGIQVQRTAHHAVWNRSTSDHSIPHCIRWWHPSKTDSPHGLTPQHIRLRHIRRQHPTTL